MLAHTLSFAQAGDSAEPNPLAELPAAPAVFSLGFGERREPYIARTTNLRRRLQRMLAPDGALSRRLQLLPFVREIAWAPYGSEFEASLLLYREIVSAFAAKDSPGSASAFDCGLPHTCAWRWRTTFPASSRPIAMCVARRIAASAHFPHAPRQSEPAMQCSILFQLRRCVEDLHPYPEHPACPYFEMKKCLAPCNQSCTPDRHRAEANAVFETLRTHGQEPARHRSSANALQPPKLLSSRPLPPSISAMKKPRQH